MDENGVDPEPANLAKAMRDDVKALRGKELKDLFSRGADLHEELTAWV